MKGSQSMELFKRLFASVTILAMAVVAIAPAGYAHAASVTAGDLIKSSASSAVYYYGSDGKRHTFPTETTYKTWYSDFSTVKTITPTELADYSLGSNVTFRAGTYLVKITTDPKVYAVSPGGALHWVKTEAAAKTIWGNDWAKMVKDLPDAFFAGNYNVDDSFQVDGTKHPVGSVIKYASSDDKYYIDSSMKKRKFVQDSFAANGFMDKYVLTSPDSITYSNGTDITGKEDALMDTAQLGSTPTPSTGNGTLSVTLAADTPAGIDVPCGATPARDINFTKVNLTATGDDVTVTNLKVKRTGLSADTDFSGVKLYDLNGNQLGTSQTFDASHKAKFTFSKKISAGSTLGLMIKGDCTASTTGRMILGVEAADDITSNAKSVSGTFPMAGNQMVGVNTSVGSITVSRGPQDPTTTNLEVDTTDFRFMQVRLTAGSTEGAKVENITFKKGDNATASTTDISGLELWNDTKGEKVANLTWDGEYLSHTFSTPISLDKGDFVDLSLIGDIAGGAAKTISFQIIDDSDWKLSATGMQYGFGLSVTPATTTGVDFGSGTATNAETEAFSIQQGKLIVSRGTNAPAAGSIPIGGNDVKIASFNFDAKGEEIRVGSTAITLLETANFDAQLDATLYKLVDADGKVWAGPFDAVDSDATRSNASGAVVTFSSQINFPAGETELFLTAKLSSTAGTGATAGSLDSGNDKIQARFNPATALTTVKGVESNKTITPTPNANVTANLMVAQGASLVMTMDQNPITGNLVIGGKDVHMSGLRLDASGGGEDVKVTSLTVKGSGDAQFTAVMSDFSNFKLWDGDTQIGETEQCATTCTTNAGTVVFNIDAGLIVSYKEIKTLKITADPIAMSNAEKTAFDVSAGQGVGVESGASVTATATSTTNSPTQTWNTFGNLKVTLDGNNPVAKQLVAGSTGVEVARYKLRASYENVDLTQINLWAGDGTNGGTAASNIASNVDAIKLYNGSTLLGTTVFGTDGKAVMNFNAGDLRVGKDADLIVSVKVDLAVKGQLNSADDMYVGFGDADGDDSTWTGAGNYQIAANGVSSGQTITVANIGSTGAAGGSVYGGNQHVMYDGVLTLSLSANSPPGKYTQATNSEVLRVDLKATGDEILVDEIAHVKSGSCVVGNGGAGTGIAKWQNVAGSIIYWQYDTGTAWLNTSTNTTAAVGTGVTTSTLTVGAGETKTISLVGDTTSTTACTSGQSLQYTITANGTVTSGIEWADQELVGESAEVDSTLTETLPLSGNSLEI